MIVLDTHVLIWAVQDDVHLGRDAVSLIDSITTDGGLIVPAICAWEAAQLERGNRVYFHGGLRNWFQRVLAEHPFALAAFEPAIAIDSVQLDWAHKDPADRMIVATARYLDVPLLTADRTILTYAKTGQIQAIDARL